MLWEICMRAYAVGDIHGHIDLLKTAQALVAEDRARAGDATAPLVHVGDLVDRGPNSRAVVEHLMAGQQRGSPSKAWQTGKQASMKPHRLLKTSSR